DLLHVIGELGPCRSRANLVHVGAAARASSSAGARPRAIGLENEEQGHTPAGQEEHAAHNDADQEAVAPFFFAAAVFAIVIFIVVAGRGTAARAVLVLIIVVTRSPARTAILLCETFVVVPWSRPGLGGRSRRTGFLLDAAGFRHAQDLFTFRAL